MNKSKRYISSILLLCSVFLIISSFTLITAPIVNAGSLWDKQVGTTEMGRSFGETGTPTDPRDIVVNVLLVFLSFMAVIFLALIIIGGYKWMMAGGNEDKIKDAKSQMKSAVIGLFIVMASYGFTVFMLDPIRKAVTGSIW